MVGKRVAAGVSRTLDYWWQLMALYLFVAGAWPFSTTQLRGGYRVVWVGETSGEQAELPANETAEGDISQDI